MFEFINYGADQLQHFILIMLRCSGLFVLAPVFGHKSIPKPIKVGLLILLSMILSSAVSLPSVPLATTFVGLAGLAVKELLVGVIIGLMFRLVFIAVMTAGSLAGYQIGMAIVTIYDANVSGQIGIIGRLWYLLAILIFLAIDGHHLILTSFADSYIVIPPGAVSLDGSLGLMMIKYTAYVWVLALKIGAPVMITLFLTDLSLGTIARTMPTMNVFFVGFPIKIGLGMVVIAMSLPVFTYMLERAVGYLNNELRTVFLAMGQA